MIQGQSIRQLKSISFDSGLLCTTKTSVISIYHIDLLKNTNFHRVLPVLVVAVVDVVGASEVVVVAVQSKNTYYLIDLILNVCYETQTYYAGWTFNKLEYFKHKPCSKTHKNKL